MTPDARTRAMGIWMDRRTSEASVADPRFLPRAVSIPQVLRGGQDRSCFVDILIRNVTRRYVD